MTYGIIYHITYGLINGMTYGIKKVLNGIIKFFIKRYDIQGYYKVFFRMIRYRQVLWNAIFKFKIILGLIIFQIGKKSEFSIDQSFNITYVTTFLQHLLLAYTNLVSA